MTAAASPIYGAPQDACRAQAVLVSDGDRAQALGKSALLNGGWRIARECGPDAADLPGRADLVWAEFADGPGEDAPGLLRNLDSAAKDRGAAAIISADSRWIDLLAARVTASNVQLLIDPSPAERLAAMAVASTMVGAEPVRESSQEQTEGRLKQLSDEVNRIALALARLSNVPHSVETAKPVEPGDGPAVPVEMVRSIIRARRLRDQFLPGDLFADPAWDILLDLLQAEIIQHRVPVSSLCIASAVPATTALRWIRTMTDRAMLSRREDPHDARRVFIELAPATSSALRRYFDKVGKLAVV